MEHLLKGLALLALAVLGSSIYATTSDAAPKLGYPSRDANLDALPGFIEPPAGYGEVPFYWWLGDPLTKERLSWHLDLMKDMGISGLQINYAHSDKGGNIWGLTYPSDPPLFSDEWWNLVQWWSAECKKQGIAISLSDYTLGIVGQGYWMDEILAEDPTMRGRNIEFGADSINGGQTYTKELPPNTVSVIAYKLDKDTGEIIPGSGVDLRPFTIGRSLKWDAPEGVWQLATVWSRIVQNSVDPINPKTGPKIIEKFFARFEKHLPGEAGKGLNFFFSDELNFGIGGRLWNDRFPAEFEARKGYDIVPLLPALFEDIGPESPKIRLDYADVMVALSEESYFKPVFDWHNDRGMIYGCDHGGRGADVTEFGDYFRTQRWMSGPGCDQPGLSADIVKNKVASSIAHLYERPRVWLEGYHSSGWGTNTADLTSATFKNFAMGQNLLSLHGLYYSTHGGFWEWAPPCNHFRMPYWAHMDEWMQCIRRLSYLMSQGVHRCDVAIIYPVEPVQAGMDGGRAVSTAFDTGRRLYERGIDFDYIDAQSLDRAKVENGKLTVAGEAYQVLILPAMKAIRFSNLQKAQQFKEAGGTVIALGALPIASDHAGTNDPELDAIVRATLGDSPTQPDQLDKVLSTIDRDFVPVTPCFVNHRKIGQRDVYMVVGATKDSECFFRVQGKVELWDPWTGKTTPIHTATPANGGTKVRMPLTESEAQIIVFTPGKPDASVASINPENITTIQLNGLWGFELKPTMDNRFGDFRLPITDKIIGAEARRFVYVQTTDPNATRAILDDQDKPLPTITCGFGQKFWKLGPIAKNTDTTEMEANLAKLDRIDPTQPVIVGETKYYWQPYAYGLRQGVEGDPGHEGYHGLKESISNDFIALGKVNFSMTDSSYSNESDTAGRYYLWTAVQSPDSTQAHAIAGGMTPSAVWLNSKELKDMTAPINVSKGATPLLLRYEQVGRGHFVLQTGKDKPAPDYPLSMRWYNKPGVLPYDPTPEASTPIGWYRFTSPPALRSMRVYAHGNLRAWNGTEEMKITRKTQRPDDAWEYLATATKLISGQSKVTLRIEQTHGYYGGEAIPEPIALTCAPGEISLGDWSQMGALECYSGGAYYRNTVTLTAAQSKARVTLKLGDLVSSAEIRVNNKPAGVKLAPPWDTDISPFVKPGENNIEILVYNTLANHYATIPTRYRGSVKSGLIGPVSVEIAR